MNIESLIYVSEGNIPSRSAHSVHIVKFSQALAREVTDFSLLTLGDLKSLFTGRRFDFCEWYNIYDPYKIVQIPLQLSRTYPFPQYFEYPRFFSVATLYSCICNPSLIYTRSRDVVELSLKAGQPVIWEWHGKIESGMFEKDLYKSPNFVGLVVISDIQAARCIENGLSLSRVLVEQDCTDIQGILPCVSRREARKKLGFQEDAWIAVYSGHLYDFKGIPQIIEAAERLTECQFVFVGGWPEDIERNKIICKKKGLNNTHFCGFVPQKQLSDYLYMADVFLLPNSGKHDWSDTTSPLKLFDYMAANRPIIASRLPNICEVIKDRENGILIEPDCSDSLVAAVRTIKEDSELAERITKQAHEDVQYYDWAKRAERILLFAKERTPVVGTNIFERAVRVTKAFLKRRD